MEDAHGGNAVTIISRDDSGGSYWFEKDGLFRGSGVDVSQVDGDAGSKGEPILIDAGMLHGGWVKEDRRRC